MLFDRFNLILLIIELWYLDIAIIFFTLKCSLKTIFYTFLILAAQPIKLPNETPMENQISAIATFYYQVFQTNLHVVNNFYLYYTCFHARVFWLDLSYQNRKVPNFYTILD